MLFTLGLLLLLTPFPSIQTTTNEKRDSTGSDVTKPNAAFTLSKPKTTSTLAKQTIRPTLKPNTVNQTVLPTPAANQKPLTVNATATTKSKAGPAISHTTQSAAVKAATGITTKDKHTSSGNQTVVAKSPSTSEVKANKDKPVPTVAPNVQSSSAKSASASSTKATKDIKDKVQPSVNQTVSVKSPSATDGKTAKDKSNPTVIQNVQSTSTKSAPASAAKTSKSKPTASVNQTVVAKSPSTGDVKTSKDKSAPTTVQTPLSTPAKTATASGSSADKDKVAAPANRTTVTKAPTTTTAAPTTAAATANTTPKEKPAPSQPIKVVISDGCDSSKAKEQELQLKPGAPLVMTHKISLLPGGCTGGCESEMAALKVRLARLEKEMSQLKDKCPCSASCPDDCSGNGECEKGKCVCHQGFVGPDCSKCAQGVVCNKKATKGKAKETVEVVTMQKNDQKKETEAKNDQKETEAKNDQKETEAKNNQKETEAKNDQKKEAEAKTDQKKATEAKEQDSKARVATNVKPVLVKTQAKQEVSVKKIAVKGSSTTAKTNRPTVGQVLLKHEGRKQEEARKGKTTVLSSKKVVQKPDLKLVKEGTAGKTFPKSDQLKDEPHTNVTQGNVKKSNGTAKIVTLLTKSVATNKTRTGKETLEQSTLVQKNVTQSSGQKRVQTVKVETTNVQSVDSRNTEAGKAKVNLQSIDNKITEAGKAKVNIQSVDNKITETGKVKVNVQSVDNKNTEAGKVKVNVQSVDNKNTEAGKVKVNVQSVDNKNTEAGKVKVNVQSVDNKNTEAGKVKVNVQSVDNKNTEAGKVKVNVQSVDNKNTEAGKVKVTQRSQYIVNTTIAATSDEARVLQNKTSVHVSGTTKGKGGSGLGSVKIVNISSYSFTITWSAPQGMFKNFTVIRREPRTEGDEDDHEEYEEEALEGDKTFVAKNPSEIQITAESTNMTASSGKTTGSRTKAETKRISMSVPGNVRSVEFSNLRANTRYFLHIYGTSAERRSKIHRVSAVTGPEPATDMVFSNVTESSLTVSWAKPKTTFTGFRVTYTNIVTGESRFIVVNSQQSYMVLSKLSAGSSYIISVTSTQGRVQSDALVSVITTVPAPPTHLQVVNVTDTRALLQWTPSLGKVDRFIISYESSKTPNVTVTVMLSGNAVEHQLRGLQRGTLYTVKVLSQKDSHQSMAISTTFTTANVVKASEVGARSAVITWRTSTVVYHSYRVIYQVAGEETKEVILDPTLTEYKLTGLLPMSRYIVLVQGERDGRYTSVVTTEFITGKLRFPFPTECSQELLNGALQSGEVDIYPQGKEGQAVKVYCDMETDGGGWTVFQRRLNGKTDFYKTWSEYSAGFGNLSDEFWLGNELLHNLTSVGPVSLRVDLRSGNDTAYAHYANFSIDSEEKHYTLTVTGYTGTAGDSMRYHNGRPFSTRDKNPDSLGIHCARAYMGGWWYKNCYKTNLNGLYGINSNNQGIVWIDWKGKDSSIPFTEMKFRPSRFSPATHG